MKGYSMFLRCLFVILFLTIYSSATTAGSGTAFDKIVFFGDSLSDAGTLYRYDFGFLPKSPPYYDGRFSNGYLWSERVAKYFYDKRYVGFKNYAVGGETVIFHDPRDGFLPYSLSMSLKNYLWHTLLQDRSTTLFVIWIGGNDYLRGASNVDALTSSVVENIKAVIEKLICKGGMNFLIINIPNISQLPYAKTYPDPQILNQLSVQHNSKLKQAVTQIQNTYSFTNIHLFEASELLSALLADPEYYNKKYNIHLVHTTTACWIKHVSLYPWKGNEELVIQRKLEEHLKQQSGSHLGINLKPSEADIKGMAHYIATSPALYEAYRIREAAEKGDKPCDNPNEYVFWDDIHPSEVVHFMFSHRIIEYIEQNYTHV